MSNLPKFQLGRLHFCAGNTKPRTLCYIEVVFPYYQGFSCHLLYKNADSRYFDCGTTLTLEFLVHIVVAAPYFSFYHLKSSTPQNTISLSCRPMGTNSEHLVEPEKSLCDTWSHRRHPGVSLTQDHRSQIATTGCTRRMPKQTC